MCEDREEKGGERKKAMSLALVVHAGPGLSFQQCES